MNTCVINWFSKRRLISYQQSCLHNLIHLLRTKPDGLMLIEQIKCVLYFPGSICASRQADPGVLRSSGSTKRQDHEESFRDFWLLQYIPLLSLWKTNEHILRIFGFQKNRLYFFYDEGQPLEATSATVGVVVDHKR
ncbi:unnamed protein product [Caenorhabditis auriculariae]|uniref:Uncharacterized protein n=1 Tax=Caenorhabditis auriculariae TaxID=2777116 RepID=A0A8S1GU88_9PELO|nr:unnamed protein product [Caenorhabditis auriculariae]